MAHQQGPGAATRGCGPCLHEMPVLAAYAAERTRCRWSGVNVQDRPATALSLLAELGVHFPSITRPRRGVAARTERATCASPSFVVRPDGSLALVPPQVFGSVEDVRQAVAEHLPPRAT